MTEEKLNHKILKKDEFEKMNIFGMGNPNDAYAKYFVGNSFLNPLTEIGSSSVFLANVTFEPGCRNNWHIHHATKGGGQILICTAGEGWYQEEGKEAIPLKPGMIITIPTNVKHWHGAKKDSWFSHIAVEVPGENCSNEWCEPVTDERYKRNRRHHSGRQQKGNENHDRQKGKRELQLQRTRHRNIRTSVYHTDQRRQ